LRCSKDNEISVRRYFPLVKDFDRDENNDIVWNSLSGPGKIEARQQLARERAIAASEVKLLHEQLRWCYFKEGVNHLENCKHLVEKVREKVTKPYWGMEKAPSHFER
jgi:NADH-ubiquinone oxidoreductase subunit 10